jgi:porin
MARYSLKFLALLLLFSSAPLIAQDIDTQTDLSASEKEGDQGDDVAPQQDPDSAPKAYTADDGFGGPKTIGAQLERDNTAREYRFPVLVFSDWFEHKKRINDEFGIQYNLNYETIASWASQTSAAENEDFAASGIATALMSWQAVGRESGNVGRLNIKFQSRHKFTDVAPMFLGFEGGYNSLAATGFRDWTPRFSEFNWSQALLDNRIHFVAGKVDSANYFTFHGLLVPWTDFLGFGFSVNGTVNWPDPGWGAVGSIRPTENLYVTFAATDVQGDRFEDGDLLCCGENFFNGRLFTAIEVGYVPSFADRFFRKISVTYWHTDEYEISDAVPPDAAPLSPEAEGFAVTAHWTFDDWITPFVTYGKGDGVGANTFYRESFSIGSGFKFQNYDVLGIGYNHSRVLGSAGLPSQDVLEIYYRFMITEHLEISPDIQFVKNPTLDPNLDSNTFFQLRLRLTF